MLYMMIKNITVIHDFKNADECNDRAAEKNRVDLFVSKQKKRTKQISILRFCFYFVMASLFLVSISFVLVTKEG